LRGTFVVGADPKVSRRFEARPLIDRLLGLAALPAMARDLRASATHTAARAGLAMAAGVAALVGLACFSVASLTLLERHFDPAAAWALLGGVYAGVAGGLYFAATRRRRG
jgi:hypothetical protein